MPELLNDTITLRGFRSEDKTRMAELLNNKKIWDNVRDYLPHPYKVQDAEAFISICQQENPASTFAIEYQGAFVGVIGLVKQTDVHRLTAEIGYWVGEPYWGKGIAQKAVKKIVEYGFAELGLVRIHAGIFDFNKASQRVLEKCGFQLEGIFRKASIKNGVISDDYRYSIVKE